MTRPILVTGGQGQVALALEAAGGAEIRRVGRPEFDFDQPDTLSACVAAADPWLVVNAAAYTAVDAAETDAAAAYRANAEGPGRLADICAGRSIPLIHISTDYVFDGSKGEPYLESDPTAPATVYGRTKRDGEVAVLSSPCHAIVLRTAWVVSPTGKNFVRTMINAARKTDRLRVVADQRGNPTAAEDLAAAILAIAERLRGGWRAEYRGVTHAAGTGDTTWHGLAEAVFARAAVHGLTPPKVDRIATADWPTPARRPADSRLDTTRLARVFEAPLPRWEDGITRVVDGLFSRERII